MVWDGVKSFSFFLLQGFCCWWNGSQVAFIDRAEYLQLTDEFDEQEYGIFANFFFHFTTVKYSVLCKVLKKAHRQGWTWYCNIDFRVIQQWNLESQSPFFDLYCCSCFYLFQVLLHIFLHSGDILWKHLFPILGRWLLLPTMLMFYIRIYSTHKVAHGLCLGRFNTFCAGCWHCINVSFAFKTMHGNKKVAVCDDYVLDGRQVLFFIQEDLLLNLWLNQDHSTRMTLRTTTREA